MPTTQTSTLPPPSASETPEMVGENVICFARDWFENPTSNNHVMNELAKRNRVLWLNSVATRAPSMSGRDIKKIFRKLAGFFKGYRRVQPNLYVYSPIVIPLPHSRWAAAINRFIMRLTLKILRHRLGMKEFQLWTFLPTVHDYVGELGESISVYYCVDEWSKFTYVDGPRLAASEEKLCRKCDVVFATAQSLVDRRLQFNPHTYLARHGVDHPLFAAAMDPKAIVPEELAALQPPVLGFYGTIQDWVDLDLVAFLAQRNPRWSIALVGKTHVDISRFEKLPNVHFFGPKPHAMLPMYCKGLAVGLIPQKVNELTVHMNPLKLREYLCAGLPVVATALPEVKQFSQWAAAADSYEDFEKAVAQAIATDTPEKRRQRSDAMKNETWEKKVADAGAIVMQQKAQKCRKI